MHVCQIKAIFVKYIHVTHVYVNKSFPLNKENKNQKLVSWTVGLAINNLANRLMLNFHTWYLKNILSNKATFIYYNFKIYISPYLYTALFLRRSNKSKSGQLVLGNQYNYVKIRYMMWCYFLQFLKDSE